MKSQNSNRHLVPRSKKKIVSCSTLWRTSGLTLIEVLIAMGIASVAGILLLVIIVNSARLFTQQSSKVAEGLNINDALAQVRNSIKQASVVASQYANGPTTYVSGPGQLVLQVASIDSSGDLIANTVDYFVFFLDQNFLRFKIFPDASSSRKAADQILAYNVNSLNFQYFNSAAPPAVVSPTNATKIIISLTLQQKADVGFTTNTATSEANLRND